MLALSPARVSRSILFLGSKDRTDYNRALKAGADLARISGAGGGGFMIFLVDLMRKLQLGAELPDCEESGMTLRS